MQDSSNGLKISWRIRSSFFVKTCGEHLICRSLKMTLVTKFFFWSVFTTSCHSFIETLEVPIWVYHQLLFRWRFAKIRCFLLKLKLRIIVKIEQIKRFLFRVTFIAVLLQIFNSCKHRNNSLIKYKWMRFYEF